MRVFDGVDDLRAAVGTQLGTGDWVTIEQGQIDTFADSTNDHQWIHVDPERAKEGPFGTTIAHGFLTLSLLPSLVSSVFEVHGTKMGVNYGLNKVRFTSPVPVGSKVRAVVDLDEVADVTGGVQVITKITVEIEGAERPALVAEWLTRRYV
ncbi:MaoC family dehydratase [Pseudonocardia sp. KRD-184]|uniref:MaoC family dehydratase n=1 Tax=Pseudonocardia oceani TaxID=2792013 RepID=A0ABS6UAK4_9PSEU|nr:MaoC family dehydratase [Pseudonocardia oceani]MBW0088381.1 MaoC family dehydratase [Pseudonocardia oceani]MBW0094955.1 MaoC family dehydratase [Pseudonocardia oceani]MBW0107769.1 MaoC family dehydratase [Pseudonocardia oceani]MBW0120227.1 MaoC family dehydratase [Pseudonocardia oceani]MBW0128951.1 MaoC family dehydratase [Pseudonocardia oceani]